MKQLSDYTYTLKLMVLNRPGVLVRCVQVFSRRGHNIAALQVIASDNAPDESSMTITAFGKPEVMDQIVAQLTKLVDVISVKEEI